MTSTIPPDREQCSEEMSNFDHVIDAGFAEKLRSGCVGKHHAWNFCGYVWFAEGAFHEEVWRHGAPREVVTAATLEELMDAVNEKYGDE